MDRQLLHKYTTATSRFMVIDNTMVHYRDEGSGWPVLMLHGAFSSLHTFNDWARLLVRRGFRVVRYDMPGFGLTGPTQDGDYSMPNHLRFARTLLDRLGIGRCHVVGNSLGGWVAWEFALAHSKLVDKLVLISSAGFIDEKTMPLPFRLARTSIVGRAMQFMVRKPLLEQFVKQVYFDERKVTPLLVDRYYDLFTREGNIEAFLKLVNTRYRDNTRKLRTLQQPTLIMWGEEDRWLPVADGHLFHTVIPNSELIVYKRCGHVAMEELAEVSVKDLLRFFETPSWVAPNLSAASDAEQP